MARETLTSALQRGQFGFMVLPAAPSRYTSGALQCGQGLNDAYAIESPYRQGRLTMSFVPHPTQNVEPCRRDTACCSTVQSRCGIARFTTTPHCGQYGTGALARR